MKHYAMYDGKLVVIGESGWSIRPRRRLYAGEYLGIGLVLLSIALAAIWYEVSPFISVLFSSFAGWFIGDVIKMWRKARLLERERNQKQEDL